MASPLFDFFETIADELAQNPSRVITREALQMADDESPILDALKAEMGVATSAEAIAGAMDELRLHFESKGADLPFTHDPVSGRFTAVDTDFIDFVREMKSIRSIGKRSKDFECTVAKRLGLKATGTIHRVGWPRDRRKSRRLFNEYLRPLGFQRSVALGKEKDGGLDILWLLPLGTIPLRPIISLQCKNGAFDLKIGDLSMGASGRSLDRHDGLQRDVHMQCVVYNDYIHPGIVDEKRLQFVPLGLTDFAKMRQPVTIDYL
jgi:hypothetical protein